MADRPCDCLRLKNPLSSCQHCQWFCAGRDAENSTLQQQYNVTVQNKFAQLSALPDDVDSVGNHSAPSFNPLPTRSLAPRIGYDNHGYLQTRLPSYSRKPQLRITMTHLKGRDYKEYSKQRQNWTVSHTRQGS